MAHPILASQTNLCRASMPCQPIHQSNLKPRAQAYDAFEAKRSDGSTTSTLIFDVDKQKSVVQRSMCCGWSKRYLQVQPVAKVGLKCSAEIFGF